MIKMKYNSDAIYRFYKSNGNKILIYDTVNQILPNKMKGIGYYTSMKTEDVPDDAIVQSGYWDHRHTNTLKCCGSRIPKWKIVKEYSGKEFKNKFYTKKIIIGKRSL